MIDIDIDRLIELVQGMVRIPSHIPEEGPLAEFLAREMERGGAFDEVQLQTVVAGRYNAIGVMAGTGDGPNLVFNGHLDALRPIGDWKRDPYCPSIEDGFVYGLGLTDMKAALACMIVAAEAVKREGVERRGSIVMTAVMHHGIPGLGSKFFLESWDRPLHACINGEPTNLKVQLAHGGCWQFEITTYGKAVHNSRREEGVDAIKKMLPILAGLDESVLSWDPKQALPGLPRMVLGCVEAGPSPSRTAARCVARGDVRIVPGMTQESLMEDLRRYVERAEAGQPGPGATVKQIVHQRPYRADPEAAVVRAVVDAHREVTGEPPGMTDGLPAGAYITDSPDFMRHGIPTAVYGPGDWTVEPDERIAVADLITAAKTYALAAGRLVT
ncbi:MAG: M20 family metallopeptidase [Chloroflexota bacterium]